MALTDFKLQGRTLNKLIIAGHKHNKPPYMDACGLYVLLSRVRKKSGLRWLNFPSFNHLAALKHRVPLQLWCLGYADHGMWDSKLLKERITQKFGPGDHLSKPQSRKPRLRKDGKADSTPKRQQSRKRRLPTDGEADSTPQRRPKSARHARNTTISPTTKQTASKKTAEEEEAARKKKEKEHKDRVTSHFSSHFAIWGFDLYQLSIV